MDILYESPQIEAANGQAALTDLYIFVDKCPSGGESGLIAEDRLEVGVCGRFSPDYRLNRFASLERGSELLSKCFDGGASCDDKFFHSYKYHQNSVAFCQVTQVYGCSWNSD